MTTIALSLGCLALGLILATVIEDRRLCTAGAVLLLLTALSILHAETAL